MKNIVYKAALIAHDAHKDQRRKWGEQEPYFTHPEWCAIKAKELGYSEVEQATMYLHDVLEDVAIPTNTVAHWENRIKTELAPYGELVLARCWELTNTSDTKEWQEKHPHPSRQEKFAANMEHIRQISDEAKRNKMIDSLANILTAKDAPLSWRRKYIPEKKEVLATCRYADEKLGQELEDAIYDLEHGN